MHDDVTGRESAAQWVATQLAHGVSRDAVAAKLGSLGWPPHEIERLMNQPQASSQPPASTARPTRPPRRRMSIGLTAIIVILIFIVGVGSIQLARLSKKFSTYVADAEMPAMMTAGNGKPVPDVIPNDDVPKSELNNIDPTTYLTAWNFNNLPPAERQKVYKETPLPNGTMKREYWFTVEDKTITIAKGITMKVMAFNGQVPGPTIRATEGDTVVIHFKNTSTLEHSIHLHGYHTADMDGATEDQYIKPNGTFDYIVPAEPEGLQVYHCHVEPLAEHINMGMYGTYIVDPRNDTRPKPDKELVVMMNGFDTQAVHDSVDLKNGEGENTIYAANTVAFWYMNHPINVKKTDLVRVYLSNMTEFDPINSFHLHGNFFSVYPTGTGMTPSSFTDTIGLMQGERAVLDIHFQNPGTWMFHSHKNEFTNKGWMSAFNVTD